MNSLPVEIICKILSYLDIFDICKILINLKLSSNEKLYSCIITRLKKENEFTITAVSVITGKKELISKIIAIENVKFNYHFNRVLHNRKSRELLGLHINDLQCDIYSKCFNTQSKILTGLIQQPINVKLIIQQLLNKDNLHPQLQKQLQIKLFKK